MEFYQENEKNDGVSFLVQTAFLVTILFSGEL